MTNDSDAKYILKFEGTENLNLSGIPIIHIDAPNVQITSFLSVPETPVRMGIRSSDHRSFIISSTPFQKAEEDKINKKRLAEVEKENRCKERQIKKEKKIQEALFKQQRKKEKLENKLNSKSKPIKKRATNKPIVKYDVTPGNKNNQVTTKFSSPRRTTLGINSAEGNAPHVRQLFSNDEEVDVHINNNSKTSNGICFQCAGHITASKMGVTCKLCKYRTYHEECAKKITNDIEDFHCQCCSIK